MCLSVDSGYCSSSSKWKLQLIPLLIFPCARYHSPPCQSVLKEKLGNEKDDAVPLDIYLGTQHF